MYYLSLALLPRRFRIGESQVGEASVHHRPIHHPSLARDRCDFTLDLNVSPNLLELAIFLLAFFLIAF